MSGLSLHEENSAGHPPLAAGTIIGTAAPSDWIVLACHAHKESVALDNLRRQDFTCYCPMLRRQVRHARRTYDSVRPLFPSYVFVAMDFDRRSWRALLSTRGVRSVISCGETPSTLKNEFIDSLRAREVDGAISRPPTPYSIGQRVRLNKAAFDGLVATIVDIDEKDRVVVLLDLLSRPVRVNVKSIHIGEIAV